jgi:hypothetical protein
VTSVARTIVLPRRALVPLGVALVCACASAPPPAPAFEASSAPIVTLPLSFREGLPEVEVVIGGRSLSLTVDLGDGDAMRLAPSILGELRNASYTGRSRRFRDARGVLHASREFTVDALSLGPMSMGGITGHELVFSDDFAPPNRTGVVGRAMFARHRLLVDYAGRQLAVLSGDPQSVEQSLRGRPAVPVRIDSNGILVAATLDGVPTRFVIDTGATRSTLRSGGSRGGASSHDLRVGDVDLRAFELIHADIGPPAADGMLGRNFFEGRRILVDLPERRLWIE